jgi:hypothetical protein
LTCVWVLPTEGIRNGKDAFYLDGSKPDSRNRFAKKEIIQDDVEAVRLSFVFSVSDGLDITRLLEG